MTPRDFEDHYTQQAGDEDAKTQQVRVTQFNRWTDIIREVVDSIMRHVANAPPQTVDWVIEDDTRKVSWGILKYANPNVNLLSDGRLVVVESRPFYEPPKPRRRQPSLEYSRYDKHVVEEVLLDHVDSHIPWQHWDASWRLRERLCRGLVVDNTFHLPVDEFNERYERAWGDLLTSQKSNH